MQRHFSYYNNGKENIRVYEGDIVPDGYVPGMKPRDPEVNRRANEQRKRTCLERYGVESVTQSKEVQEKIEKTCMERYGVKAPSMNEEIKAKARQTCLEVYGVPSSAMNEEVKERAKQTCLERYGTISSAQNEEIKAKAAKTCIERYGAKAPTLSDEIFEKVRQTNLKNLGVEYPLQSKKVQEKSRQTSLKRYGTEYTSQADEVREKVAKTCLERYGVKAPSMNEDVKEKARQTFLEKYGVENPSQAQEVKDKRERTMIERFGYPCSFQSPMMKERVRQTCLEKYGVEWPCMRPEARAYSNDSSPNKAFAEILDSLSIPYEREFSIGRYSYDFKVDNTLIEINPFPTHNSLWGIFGGEGLSSDYHYHKSHTAEENGFRCIHIFDWDDVDKILNLLIPRKRIYARKCTLKEVPVKECNSFLLWNHLQGICKGQDVCLGLYYQDELVSVMTFGKPRYNKNYQYELLRYCSSYNIIGGAEKLFSHFVKDYQPESIISYCNRAKFLGKVYPKLGFRLKSSGQPSKHWYSGKEERHITDNLLRQRGYDQIFNESYGKGTSNEELIIQRGYVPIYDCGQDSYVWEKS